VWQDAPRRTLFRATDPLTQEMEMTMSASSLVGQPLLRKEDKKFLTGAGSYTDDLLFAGLVHGAFVRSPHPHARIRSIDTKAARGMLGVLLVLTSRELEAAGVGVIPSLRHDPQFSVADTRSGFDGDAPQYPLARDKVRYAGEPVVFVVGTSVALAREACEAVVVDYEPLAPVIEFETILGASKTPIFDAVPDNCTLSWRSGDAQATDSLFCAAAHVAKVARVNNRVAIAFMEPRSMVAEFDSEQSSWCLSAGSQGAHGLKQALSTIMGINLDKLRVITPDTGGGFGARGVPYPEYTSVLQAARELGVPVRWTSDRSEAFLSDTQSRDHMLKGELAIDAQGKFTALRAWVEWRHGGYLGPRNAAVMVSYLAPTLGGVYTIEQLDLHLKTLLSNTTPHAAYRGIGRMEATFLMESLVDEAARVTGVDPVTIRRKNLVPQDCFPWRAAGGATFSNGAFEHNMDEALRLADHAGFAARRERAQERGLRRGFGLAMFVENDGGAPTEFARTEVLPSGEVVLYAGTQDFGMGHTTVYSQVVGDALGVPFESVRVVEGDTATVAMGSGSHGSRSARVGGGAIVHSALALIEKGRLLAAEMFEAAAEDVAFDAGNFVVTGTDRQLSLMEVAVEAGRHGDQLDGEHLFKTTGQAHSNGAQVCELEVDPETGTLTIAQHVIVADVGRLLNPLIVTGQMHGGLAQGIGQAWLEEVVFDVESGQTLSGSFMDYAIPRADDMPDFVTAFTELNEPDNPLGVKGAGEGPTSGAPAAFMIALRDALGPDAGSVEMPATPERVWRAMNA
jgi:carbon-monoxide dehydrogenase large subunit